MQSLGSRAQLPIPRVVVAAFLTASFCLLVPAQAQQQPPPDQPQLTSKDVNDEEMEKFVAAYEAVEVIRIDLQKKMATVQDAEGANQLQQVANAEMVAAVQGNDLEPQRYNVLSHAISNDEELLSRFKEMQKERAEKQKQQENK